MQQIIRLTDFVTFVDFVQQNHHSLVNKTVKSTTLLKQLNKSMEMNKFVSSWPESIGIEQDLMMLLTKLAEF